MPVYEVTPAYVASPLEPLTKCRLLVPFVNASGICTFRITYHDWKVYPVDNELVSFL